MPANQELKKIKNILETYKILLEKENFPIKSMILYGSRAKGNSKSYSDIDVCIISDKILRNKDQYENFLWKKVLEIDPRIEPVIYYSKDFNDADPLVNEIKKYGIKIK